MSNASAKYPSDAEIGTWFQLSTCAHHIDPDGEYIKKRARFIAEKACDWARAEAKEPTCKCQPDTWFIPPPAICANFDDDGVGVCNNCEHDRACHPHPQQPRATK